MREGLCAVRTLLPALLLLVSSVCVYAQDDEKEIARLEEVRAARLEAFNRMRNLRETALTMQGKGKYDEMVQAATDYYNVAMELGEINSYEFTEMAQIVAREHRRRGEHVTAADIMEYVVAQRRTLPGVRPGNLCVSLSTLGQIYQEMNRIDTAIVLQEEALRINIENYGNKDKNVPTDKVNLAAMLYTRQNAGDLQRAITLVEEAVKDLPSSSKAKAAAMSSLVLYYNTAGNRLKAAKLSPKALKVCEKTYGKNSVQYATMLANHSLGLANSDNVTSAIEYATEARRIFEENNRVSLSYANLLRNLASYLNLVERYDESIETYEKAAEAFARLDGDNRMNIMSIKGDMTAVYNKKGDSERAEMLIKEIESGNGDIDQNSSEYARMLRSMAGTQASIGNYTAAMDYARRAIDIFQANNQPADVAVCISSIASYHNSLGHTDEAMQTIAQAISLFDQSGHSTSANRAQALNTQSILMHNAGQTEQALEVSRQAAAAYEQAGDTENSYYARIIANQAVYLYTLGQTDQAIEQIRKSLAIQEKVLGPDHTDNVMSIFNLAVFYKQKGEKELTDSTYHRALNMQMNYVRRNFAHLTSRERELYWNKKSYVLRAAPDFAYTSQGNAKLMTDTYNTMLFTKGLLLNSEIDFRNLLSSTGNVKLKQQFDDLVALNRSIDDAMRPDSEVSASELQQMRHQADAMERSIVSGCKEFGDFTQNMSITTEDICRHMSDEDVAIEFMKVNLGEGDYGYSALMLRRDWPAPVMVHLFTLKQLDEDFVYDGKPVSRAITTRNGINQAFADPELGAMVWEKLASAWGDDVRRVYFSPDGMMYQWGIEYLICGERGRMCETYDMRRVSSTKTLCQQHSGNGKMRGAAIFGGMAYNLTLDELLNDHNSISRGEYATFYAMANQDDVRDLAFSNDEALDSLMVRDLEGKFLPGTYAEGETISELMMNHDIEADWYAYDGVSGIGSEAQFKSLSGQKRNIIHIATHGFYLTQNEMARHFGGMASTSDEDNAHDNSMNCSGLLMAGANYALKGGKLPAGIENGILTAREISLLDLRGLRLVVLSACKTGMGEVKDEGVFGLQRGFKKAGAETLMMSLWSVDDAATKTMMASFYNSLFSGNDRHQAHRDARQAVKDAGYDEPYYWGSFIMLD